MPTLSLCMIVKNEEEFLEQCLSSVKYIADEIIIVDTGSTDRTKEIAKKFNAKVIEHKWNNNFSEARNISLEHATKEWILVLDADEAISREDLPKIKILIKNRDFDGYMLVQRTYMNNSESQKWVPSKDDIYTESKPYAGWVYSGITRLFKNRKDIRFEYPVHETVMESIKRANGKIGAASIPIHHYGKVRGKKYVDGKSSIYLELGKKKIEEKGSAKAYYEYGVQCQVLGRLGEAAEAFRKSISLNRQMIPAYINLGSIYLMQGKTKEAVETLEEGNSINPNNSHLKNNLGLAYEKSNDERAVDEFKKSIQLNPDNAEPCWNLARIYTKKQNFAEAARLLEKIIQLNPKNALACNNLGGLYAKLNRNEEAISILEKAIKIEPKNIDLFCNLAVIYVQQKDFAKALENFEKALGLEPDNEEIKKGIERVKKIIK